jgi:3-methyladenine DNA glycosylase AlkD
MGLTVHRKLAKQIGKDHDLALELWDSNIYDMKVISILIDDPKLISIEQMESQVKDINFGYLVHVFSACGAPVAKTPFIVELTNEWVKDSDTVKNRCAYGFLYETSKSKKKSAPDDDYFLKHINHIDQSYTKVDKSVHMSMAAALMGMGKRNLILNQAALKVANKIGPVPVETGKTKCEPFDVTKHLTSDYLIKKLNA